MAASNAPAPLPTLIEWQGPHPYDRLPSSPRRAARADVARARRPQAVDVLRLPAVQTVPSAGASAREAAFSATCETPRGAVTLDSGPDPHAACVDIEDTMTDELFRDDSPRCANARPRVIAADATGIQLDRTVFYPLGGGQAGDAGVLRLPDGTRGAHRRHPQGAQQPGEIVHRAGTRCRRCSALQVGTPVTAQIDWRRRHRHMRFHTATHLLCALVPHPVDGCSITADYARLDFHMTEPLDKEALTAGPRSPGGRGACGEPPLDQRGRARRQPGPGAQHERAAAARPRAACA